MQSNTKQAGDNPVSLMEEFKEVWERIKQFLLKLAKKVVHFFEQYVGILHRHPGNKRRAKAKMLTYFESISKGKSNNWRKVHGLHLARSHF